MIEFVEKVPIDSIQGAEYNPRVITPDALKALEYSIGKFGMVKPLIINASNNNIVAGHQRRKAALALGMTHVPCIKIGTPNMQDEIHFNLLHNSIETSQTKVRVEEFVVGEYSYCPSSKIRVETEPKNLVVCSEINRLLSLYTEWGSIVTDENGNVLLNAEYAYCAKKMGFGVLCYAIKNDDVKEFLECIGVEYGRYNYDNLGIKTYHQFKAQLKRRSADGRRQNESSLYERFVIPSIQLGDSIIDIGAGRMDYVKLLKSQGHDIHAYEPSLMTKGSNSLDMKGIIANILDAEKAVKENGLFDWCILSFVINSIVDDEFEKAVLTLCNATLKADGTLLTCTRNIESIHAMQDKNSVSAKSGISMYCLDDKNYSLSISQGIAFKQKFHTKESYVELLENFFEDVKLIACDKNSIFCACTRPIQLEDDVYEEYLEKELNIEYPNGFKHNKHRGLMEALIMKVAARYET